MGNQRGFGVIFRGSAGTTSGGGGGGTLTTAKNGLDIDVDGVTVVMGANTLDRQTDINLGTQDFNLVCNITPNRTVFRAGDNSDSVVIGDVDEVTTGFAATVEPTTQTFIVKNKTGKFLSVDPGTSRYRFGNIDNSIGFKTFLEVADAGQQIEAKVAAFTMMRLNNDTRQYMIGQVDNDGGIHFDLRGQQKTCKLMAFNGFRFVVDVQNKKYQLGDIDNVQNQSKLTIDDSLSKVTMQAGSDATVELDSTNKLLKIKNTTLDLGLEINGQAGFSGLMPAGLNLIFKSGLLVGTY